MSRNIVKYPKLKAFEVWCTSLEGQRKSLGYFEDANIAHKYLEAFINGSGPEHSWEYGVDPIIIQLKSSQ